MNWGHLFPSDALGKFCGKDSLLKILSGGSLLWSRPDRFNDPFDCQPHFRMPEDRQKALSAVRNEFSRVMAGEAALMSLTNPLGKSIALMANAIKEGKIDAGEAFAALEISSHEILDDGSDFLDAYRRNVVLDLNSSKILCLTKSFDNILMWSHYAENHSGALVIFAPRTKDSQFSLARPVTYLDEIPEIMSVEDFSKFLTGQVSMTDSAFIRASYDRVTMVKSSSWSYENEWRIVGGDGFKPESDSEVNRFSMDDLVAVVFGLKHPHDEMHAIIETASVFYPNARWYTVSQSVTRFALEIHQIS